ncbi:MAG: RNA polymerase sigma-70 factor [Bacteroidota bacterium]
MRNRPYRDLADQTLIDLLQTGDQDAFSEIYCRYTQPLYIHALKMLKDRDEAKDVIQEIFAKLWVKREDLVLTTSLSSYLYTAVRNKIFDAISHEKVVARYQQSLQVFIDKGEFITDNWIREKELTILIEKEIAELPPKMRAVFELSRKEHLSYAQISEELDVSENTVRKHITKALKKLRDKLEVVTIIIPLLIEMVRTIKYKI